VKGAEKNKQHPTDATQSYPTLLSQTPKHNSNRTYINSIPSKIYENFLEQSSIHSRTYTEKAKPTKPRDSLNPIFLKNYETFRFRNIHFKL